MSTTSQTGYKRHWMGVILHWWTLVTYFGWMFLLGGVSYLYMNNLDDDEDLVLVLKMFAVVWNTGLIWSFLIKYPQSLSAVFLRRCNLSEATQVAIYHEIQHGPDVPEDDSIFPTFQKLIGRLSALARSVLAVVFAGAGERPDPKKAVISYCNVMTNPDGSRYFVFLYRRYNFDVKRQIFVPGVWETGKTFVEIAPQGIEPIDPMERALERGMEDTEPTKYRVNGTGLSKLEVKERHRAVGPNFIDMTKPSFISSFLKEANKPFYVYQFYILWICKSRGLFSCSIEHASDKNAI